MPDNIQQLLRRAIESDDVDSVATLLRSNPQLLNPASARPPLAAAKSVRMAERLLSLGADVKAVGQWWAPGFQTRDVDSKVANFLVERGAELTPHAAAGLGLIERLQQMLDSDPSVVHAKGGDGCTPLHFSRNTAIARLLLARGARVEARDDDHDSTPAQWLIGDVPEVARLLLDHGATPDIFMAAAFGDRALAETLIAANPACVGYRIGKGTEVPPLGYKGRGGTIYQWTLAFNSYPHQIALLKGHLSLFQYLFDNSDTTTRFLVSCLLARRSEAEAIVARNPGLVASLLAEDLQLPALYCWETNLNYAAVKLMLDVGFPIAQPENNHGYTPLHNAAWAGAADLVDLLLKRGHPVDIVDPHYKATALGFAMYDSLVEKRHPEGEFARVIRSLLEAGSPWDALCYPTGDPSLDEVFKTKLPSKPEGAALLGDEPLVFRLLSQDSSPETLAKTLAAAAKAGHTSLCQRLIDAGARVNEIVDHDENTPLKYALKSGSVETIVLLQRYTA
jgi:ankyrin repeat protein